MDSGSFFDRYSKDVRDNSVDFVEWANDYERYLALRSEIAEKLHRGA